MLTATRCYSSILFSNCSTFSAPSRHSAFKPMSILHALLSLHFTLSLSEKRYTYTITLYTTSPYASVNVHWKAAISFIILLLNICQPIIWDVVVTLRSRPPFVVWKGYTITTTLLHRKYYTDAYVFHMSWLRHTIWAFDSRALWKHRQGWLTVTLCRIDFLKMF